MQLSFLWARTTNTRLELEVEKAASEQKKEPNFRLLLVNCHGCYQASAEVAKLRANGATIDAIAKNLNLCASLKVMMAKITSSQTHTQN